MIKVLFLSVLLLSMFTANVDAQYVTLNGHDVSVSSLDRFILNEIDSKEIPAISIAIINDGKIVYQKNAGVKDFITNKSVDENSIFEAASLSKTVFAYFVMKLVDRGILDLDKPLYKYMIYKDIENDNRYKNITARMVLDHTSGLPNWRTSDFADPKRNFKEGDLYLKFNPGSAYSYSGEGYYFLSKVIAKLTKTDLTTLDNLFQKEVALPLNLQHSWFSINNFIVDHKVTGYMNKKAVIRWPGSLPDLNSKTFGAAGGLHTDAGSYAKFLIALMNGKGLSKKSVNEMFKFQVRLDQNKDYDGDIGWGLGIGIRPGVNGFDYNHRGNNGNFQSYYLINEKDRSGYVFFVSCDKGAEFNERLKKL
ncbi:serine hydrolase domain-containing protein [Flavobacterium kingsejongi]|nr:serine hydrolase domain-containing protein [Flavobacterium kingsejongi]